MNTPIYDELLEFQNAKPLMIQPNPVDAPDRQPWPLEGTRVVTESEPTWREFFRYLLWWLKP